MFAPLKLMPEISAEMWEILYGWMPGTGPCTTTSCEMSPTGTAFYIFVFFLLALLSREAYLRYSGDRGGSKTEFEVETGDIDDDEGGSARSESGETEGVQIESEGLQISPEFDDILSDDVSSKITDDNSSVLEETFEVPTGRDGPLPPHLNEEDFDPEEFLGHIERLHQRQIAPGKVEKDTTHYNVGEKYRRVLFAHDLPDITEIAGLKAIIDDPTLHFDLTIHFHALDREKTLRSAKTLFNNLDASIGIEVEEGDDLTAGDKARRKQKVRQYRDEIKNNKERPCAASIYVCVRNEDEEQLLQEVDEIRDEFRTEANIRLKTLERKQKKALVSASPIGVDSLYEDDNDIDPAHNILGSSFGAMVSSLTQSRKFEPEGHEWGIHSFQGHPIVKDPFQSPRNYNMVVVGESGSGKSLNTKRMALATKAVRKDTLIIILDPLEGFMGLSEALDATKVTIGGKQKLNPMEIRKPPDEHIESDAFDEDKDPLSAKVDDVMSFVQNYVAQQPGLEFNEESQLLRGLILAAYKRNGITHDVRTHDKQSPTLTDVLELAEMAKESPEEWAKGPQEAEDIRNHARAIGNLLREFAEGGQYEHLTESPEEDIFGDNDVVYLDLSQEEASGGSGTGIMGQLMFSLAYEKCKQYPGPAIYVIDEARFLFREADTLEYLSQRVRHSRHYDTSIRFITQEMDDFFEFEQAEGIVNNSSFQVIHQAQDVDEWGDRFGLKSTHKKYVRSLATGTDKPYSQALVRFPEEDQWYPLTIDLGERMKAIADFDPQDDRYEELPGKGTDLIEQSAVVRELQARIRNQATSHDEEVEALLEDWEEPIWEMLTEDRSQAALNQIENGAHPKDAIYTQALDQVQWLIDRSGGDDVSNKIVERLKAAIQENYAEDYTDLDPDEMTDVDNVEGASAGPPRNGGAIEPEDDIAVEDPPEEAPAPKTNEGSSEDESFVWAEDDD